MSVRIIQGDCRSILPGLPDESVNCIVTSPPYYGLRDYGCKGQIGQEEHPSLYVLELAAVFRECRRILRSDGTLWLNLGDSYAASGKGGNPDGAPSQLQGTNRGSIKRKLRPKAPLGFKPKDMIGIPWRVALALQEDGWYLRSDIIWSKPNPMPESVKDRPTRAHEYLFLMSKSERYHYDASAIQEPQSEDERRRRLLAQANGKATIYNLVRDKPHGSRPPGKTGCARTMVARQALAAKGTRNKRSVWSIPTQPFAGAHFAVMPEKLVEPCVLAGCSAGGVVMDPFGGSGTVAAVAERLGRDSVMIELNPEYVLIEKRRTAQLGMKYPEQKKERARAKV